MYQTTINNAHLAMIEHIDHMEVRTDYSGRGMYGYSCFGIVTDNAIDAVIQMTLALSDDSDAQDTADLLDALAHGACMDNMGLHAIVYWPHIRCDDSDDSDV